MFFRDTIGQEAVKEQLLKQVREGRIAHAQMLCGPKGVGKLSLAIAFARYLLCQHPGEHDACGVCPSCVKINKLAHPDLHLSFPVIKRKGSSADSIPVSDDYVNAWRQFVIQQPYARYNEWLRAMGADNQQAAIYVRESDAILHKLTLKSNEGGYKILLMWMPEKMNVTCANKLLKLLEEPPEQTLFLLVSEEPEQLLTTIQSRVQRINVPLLGESCISAALQQHYGLSPNDAISVAHQSRGSWLAATETLQVNEESALFLELFTSLMRLAYQRRVREMKQWSEQLAAMGRERQKNFLAYCQRMIRENFIYNFGHPQMVYLSHDEAAFSRNFAPFVNERNIIGLMDELSLAQQHIEQNVNAKMVFFDLSLKTIVLIKNR